MKPDQSTSKKKTEARLYQLIGQRFPNLDTDIIGCIISSGREFKLKTGEYLFQQGEAQKKLYIVVNGRLRAIAKKEGGRRILGDICAGETVGELAFFSEEPRMASVLAIRNTTVLEYTPDTYQEMVAAYPELSTSIIKLVINRLRQNSFEQHKTSPPKNIAMIHLQPSKDLYHWTDDMQKYFLQQNITVNLVTAEECGHQDDDHFFESLEQQEGLNILVCAEQEIAWSRNCLIYADLVVVVSDFYADVQLYDIEEKLDIYTNTILNKKRYLLLLHPENGARPSETQEWLEKREVDLHIHIRKNNPADTRRFCRIITNKAVGLVLGGGGAKGFAHIGVVQALREKGVEVDFLGGTSAGALYGIGMSFADFNFTKIHALNAEAVKRKLTTGDYVLPVLSLMGGRKLKHYLQEMFSDYHLEDIWVNSFCVSTNYSSSAMQVHTLGLIWRKVLASTAIPGVFPPVIIRKHLHVDGGVIDNLPIEPMYHYPVDKIIAVSLGKISVREFDQVDLPGFWKLFWDKISGRKRYRIPSIVNLILNSLSVNSVIKSKENRGKASHFIELELRGVGLLDDKKWQEIQQKGYEQTKEYLITSSLA